VSSIITKERATRTIRAAVNGRRGGWTEGHGSKEEMVFAIQDLEKK
jgi:hypothetical protein